MKQVKITSGDWKAHKRSDRINQYTYEIHWSDEGECVAEIVYGEGNANAISAVPEMIDVLERFMDFKDSEYVPNVLFDDARAALKKARG